MNKTQRGEVVPTGQVGEDQAAALNPAHPHFQYLLITAADHEILSRGIERFRRLFAGDRPPNAEAEFKAIKRIPNEKLPEHFGYEDKIVFPSLLVSHPPPAVAEQIAALTREHVALLDEARRLNALLAGRDLAKCTGELWVAMLDFFEDLEKHSRNEDAMLLRLLDK